MCVWGEGGGRGGEGLLLSDIFIYIPVGRLGPFLGGIQNFEFQSTSASMPFRFRAPTCQQDVITLQLRLCCTVFFP